MRVAFAEFTLDPEAFRLERAGAVVSVQPKVLRALCMLVSAAGAMVSRAELQRALWPDVVVTEQSLRQVIRKLRDVLGDDEAAPRYVETVHGEGYRFVARIEHAAVGRVAPAEADVFVGRQAELAELDRRVHRSRLVTVLGMGGVGKTRLVTHYLAGWSGAVWFCPLADARSIDGVVESVARTLDVVLRDGDPVDQLGRALAAREGSLVVLDNFEQVGRWAEPTLGRWLTQAPRTRFLVTSREVLGVAGEDVLAIPPLRAVDGRELFALRAGVDADPGDVAALVDKLDGLPLAIELAAVRTRVLTVRQVLDRLGDRFALLTAAGRRADRHATLAGVLDWSWSLLSADEQEALGQLSVCRNPFPVEAAEALVGLDPLQALVDKSLVQRQSNGISVLPTVQEYVVGRAGTEARERFERNHGAVFSRPTADPRAVYDNAVLACERAVAAADGALAVRALAVAWATLGTSGPASIGLELAERVLQVAPTGDDRFDALLIAAQANRLGGRPDVAHARAEEALRSADRVEAWLQLAVTALDLRRPDVAARASREALARIGPAQEGSRWRAHRNLGLVSIRAGRMAEAWDSLQTALALAPDDAARGVLLLNRHYLATERHPADGPADLRRAVELLRSVGDRYQEAQGLVQLSIALLGRAELDEAREVCERAVALARAGGWRTVLGWSLEQLGLVHFELARPDARAILEQAVEVRRPGRPGQLAAALATLATATARWDLAQEALALARTDPVPVLPYALAVASRLAPDPDRSLALAREGAEHSARMANPSAARDFTAILAVLGRDPAALDQAHAELVASGERLEVARLLVERARLDPGGPWADRAAALVPADTRIGAAARSLRG